MPKETINLLLAICTRARPQMLGELLQSCIRLTPDRRVSLSIFIVENGPDTPSHAVFERFSQQLPLIYRHEPRIGIVRARNAAVDHLLLGNADWLGFIDDDEVLDKGWLCAMADAISQHPGYSAFSGLSEMIEPDSAPAIFRACAALGRRQKAGAERKMVTTQNVIFRRDVFESSGFNLRFDMRLNTAGGSDFLLTHLLTDRGGRIRIVPEAKTVEHLLPERAALGFRTRKMIAQAHHRGLITLIRFGRFRGHLLNLLVVMQSALRLCALAPLASLVLVFNERRGLCMFSRCLLLACSVIGRPRILWRQPADIYHVVQGR